MLLFAWIHVASLPWFARIQKFSPISSSVKLLIFFSNIRATSFLPESCDRSTEGRFYSGTITRFGFVVFDAAVSASNATSPCVRHFIHKKNRRRHVNTPSQNKTTNDECSEDSLHKKNTSAEFIEFWTNSVRT